MAAHSLKFVSLDQGNLDAYKHLLLRSELVYHESIRSGHEDFVELLDKPVAFLAFDSKVSDEHYVGNVIGCELTDEEIRKYGVQGKGRVLYLFNIVILPEFQGKGYGNVMMKEFLDRARAMHYDIIAGHFRQNGSAALFRKFGGKVLKVCKDWEDTGEDYVYCELELKGSKL